MEHHLQELVNISHYLDSQDLFRIHVCFPAYVPHRCGAPRCSWPTSITQEIPVASPAHTNTQWQDLGSCCTHEVQCRAHSQQVERTI